MLRPALVELLPLGLERHLTDAKSKPNSTPSAVGSIQLLGLWSFLGLPLVPVEMEWGESELVNHAK